VGDTDEKNPQRKIDDEKPQQYLPGFFLIVEVVHGKRISHHTILMRSVGRFKDQAKSACSKRIKNVVPVAFTETNRVVAMIANYDALSTATRRTFIGQWIVSGARPLRPVTMVAHNGSGRLGDVAGMQNLCGRRRRNGRSRHDIRVRCKGGRSINEGDSGRE
jgi:hypothetical protein